MHIPKVMLAAAIDRFGDADEITIQTLPLPALAPNEVMISIDIAGVGPWDAKIRAGSYPDRKPRFPLVLGDKAIHTVGRTQKAAYYAEYVAVAADKIAHIPKRLDLEQGGAIATTGLTALQGIHDALYVKKGETVLIHRARRVSTDGVDAVLALAGGDALERALDVLRRGGQLAYPEWCRAPAK